MQRAFNRARERNLQIGIYTKPLFTTRSGEENVEEISKQTVNSLDLVGITIYGENKMVDKALNGLKFHS